MQNEAGQRLIELYQENALVIANTVFQQHKRRLYTWTSPNCQHQNQIEYAMQETWVQSLGREDALEKEMATHSSILAWRIPWTEEPGGLQSMGSQRVGHD